MIVKLRKQHVLWWILLAILLPVLIILSIIFRPDVQNVAYYQADFDVQETDSGLKETDQNNSTQ